MSRVRSKNTEPERFLRKALSAEGYRYRLHVRKLPGSPDLVFPSRGKVVFVHGCFWHSHESCNQGGPPKSNSAYWNDKLRENQRRDIRNVRALRRMGWKTLTVWTCTLRSVVKRRKTIRRVIAFLEGN
jgi:DNA mismatch endonuclease (patch repair protein)